MKPKIGDLVQLNREKIIEIYGSIKNKNIELCINEEVIFKVYPTLSFLNEENHVFKLCPVEPHNTYKYPKAILIKEKDVPVLTIIPLSDGNGQFLLDL